MKKMHFPSICLTAAFLMASPARADSRALPWPDIPLPPDLPPQATYREATGGGAGMPSTTQQDDTGDARTRHNLFQWLPNQSTGIATPPAPNPPPSVDGQARVYRVSAGDTAYRVMRQTGLPIKKLAALNGLAEPTFPIHAGQVLRLE